MGDLRSWWLLGRLLWMVALAQAFSGLSIGKRRDPSSATRGCRWSLVEVFRRRRTRRCLGAHGDFDFTNDDDDGDCLDCLLDGDTSTFSSASRRRMLQALSSATVIAATGEASQAADLGAGYEAATNDDDSNNNNAVGEVLPYSSVRRYKILTLPNGLSVLVVRDRRALRASAALSIGGAGQFADPLPGLAHLMEHMILSTQSRSRLKKTLDFEDWLSDQEGASNAFTAYDSVCFHFSCPPVVLAEALDRFACLFRPSYVEEVCANERILAREIRRVDAELDLEDYSQQMMYLSKAFVNLEHPYSRFSAGSLESLESIPKAADVDVGELLVDFFRKRYLPQNAVLVVISPQDLGFLERMVAPFGNILSKTSTAKKSIVDGTLATRSYPGGFLDGSRFKQMVLYRSRDLPAAAKGSEGNIEKLILEWTLDLDYEDLIQSSKPCITATEVAFVLSQHVGRRGPGSLYFFLTRRGYIPMGSTNVPRVMLPVDVSRFQILRMELNLTLEGFRNRSAVIAAIYDYMDRLRTGLSRGLIQQYSTIAKLHGYLLAPRPPDAVELSIDAQAYGVRNVGSGAFYRFVEDRGRLGVLQRTFAAVLKETLLDTSKALIIVTAGSKALALPSATLISDALPPLSSGAWLTEPIAKGRFCFDNMLGLPARIEELVLTRMIANEELLPPTINNLVPTTIRPARRTGSLFELPSESERLVEPSMDGLDESRILKVKSARQSPSSWTILNPYLEITGIPLPRGPPEPIPRCAFTVELLSPRPARANIRQAAHAELWKLSFFRAVSDVAELGAVGGLAYDVSFNKFGLRLTFLGLSQNLPSYARRICRRVVQHHVQLLAGPEFFSYDITESAITGASRAPGLSPQRKRRIISNLRSSRTYDAASEGLQFLQSCSGAAYFGQGDLLRKETQELAKDLEQIFSRMLTAGSAPRSAMPTIEDLSYKPIWKPRSASSCSLPGVILISDPCGRLPR